ncbi:hypothetical protein VB780_28015 [Leptolyngbya sp. CCNP1308]|uniref:hypothetical protein n=1 Tax=Leptolyngbya sp. CCNP1308 TaxID=3110255 RepID=UPI002B216E1F|nr:hypothetical protein [Leptolyngbya sp. CCNP1308]MEA5452452.1 hypothetical protein [Leptolyngbya sp. CCNP1308]
MRLADSLAEILVAALGLGMGVSFVPDALANTPSLICGMFSSGIATGRTVAMLLNMIVPGTRA